MTFEILFNSIIWTNCKASELIIAKIISSEKSNKQYYHGPKPCDIPRRDEVIFVHLRIVNTRMTYLMAKEDTFYGLGNPIRDIYPLTRRPKN